MRRRKKPKVTSPTIVGVRMEAFIINSLDRYIHAYNEENPFVRMTRSGLIRAIVTEHLTKKGALSDTDF